MQNTISKLYVLIHSAFKQSHWTKMFMPKKAIFGNTLTTSKMNVFVEMKLKVI